MQRFFMTVRFMLCVASVLNGTWADLIPWKEVLNLYRHSHFATVQFWAQCVSARLIDAGRLLK
jgi:hypothetical protein